MIRCRLFGHKYWYRDLFNKDVKHYTEYCRRCGKNQ